MSKGNHRKQGKRGYRLHDERIYFSGVEGSMRTIKYPLKGDNLQTVFDAVKHDYLAIYGDLNFNDFIDTNQKGEKRYSFIEFWVEAITTGFIFSKQSHAMEDFAKFLKIKSEGEKAFELLSDNIKVSSDKNEFLKLWAKKGDGRARKNQNNLDKAFGEGSTIIEEIKNMSDGKTETWCKTLNIDINKISDNKVDKYEYPFAYNFNFDKNEIKGENITDRLDSLIKYYKREGLDDKPKGEMPKYFALYDDYQGIFPAVFKLAGFLQENKDGFEEFASFFTVHFPADKNIIKKAFSELKNYADHLPKNPSLIKNWETYNTELGGTLESWYSNRIGKQKETINGVIVVKNATTELLEKVKAFKELINTDNEELIECINSCNDYLNDLLGVLSEIKNLPNDMLGKNEDIPDDVEGISRDLTNNIFATQAVLRTELNYFFQMTDRLKKEDKIEKSFNEFLGGKKKEEDEGSEKDSEKNKLRKDVEKKVQSSPLFFGESQIQYFEKAYNAKKIIAENLKILSNIYNDLKDKISDDIFVEAKDVQKLANTANRIESKFVNEKIKVTEEKLGCKFEKSNEIHRFYKSPFARGHFKVDLTFNKTTLKEIIKICGLDDLYKVNINSETDLRDSIALSKNLLSLLIDNTDKGKNKDATLAHSELAGLVAILSKKEFISRYTLQAQNGKQAKIYYDENTNRYGYAFPGINKDEMDFEEITYYKLSNNYKDLEPKDFLNKGNKSVDTKNVCALEIHSSKYQVQFLDWFFLKLKKRKNALQINGPFTIVDQDITIDWSGESPKTFVSEKKTKKKHEIESTRVYTSQPFTIMPVEKNRKSDDNQLENRFIGVDIGEYGLAYCVIEMNKEGEKTKVEILDKGFIKSKEQAKLKEDVKSFRKSVVKATFTSTNTHVANMRESLIQYYNNRLSDLQVRYNARLSFEIQVSAFESGGNKVSKIYDSVKRGFFYGNNAAEQADAKQVFGKIDPKENKAKTNKQLVPWAIKITAAGTSQTCSKCKQWYKYPFPENPKVRYFEENQIKEKNLNEMNEKEKSGIYKAMRPPYKDKDYKTGDDIINVGMQLVVDKLAESESSFNLDEFVKERGNSAIFVCPICGHIADADEQAALNIAVRGYLKAFDQRKPKKEQAKDYPVKFYLEKSQSVEYPTVSLF